MLDKIEHKFINELNFDKDYHCKKIKQHLHNSTDGDLFLEYTEFSSIRLEDGVVRDASYHVDHGLSVRSIIDDRCGYAYSSVFDKNSCDRMYNYIDEVKHGHTGKICVDDYRIGVNQDTSYNYFNNESLVNYLTFDKKIKLLKEINDYTSSISYNIKKINIYLEASNRYIYIINHRTDIASDFSPLFKLSISVIVEKNGKTESGRSGLGNRLTYHDICSTSVWQNIANEAVRKAELNINSIEAPAGEMPVLLGPGWPGVLLHEAVGHGLEGDFNRKKTSVFSDLIGTKVAADCVTVVDDGSIYGKSGSINIDDEGTLAEKTVLIENGILKQYLFDRFNARLMGLKSTGNGRRQSYSHEILPRMTNTFMLDGNYSCDEMIASVDNGIYAVDFGGGSVDIVSGQFVFSCTEAYIVKNGKIEQPIKGATLIGDGSNVIKEIGMIANNFSLDAGTGMCGKDGQSVPVTVGQPSLKVNKIVVGGSNVQV